MNLKELVLVRGFDLFFTGASDATIENIAKKLGGSFSFDVDEGRTTYMFSRIVNMPVENLAKAHQIANNTGERFALEFDCQYEYSELYITISKPAKLAA